MMKMEGKFINVLCWLWSWWSEFVWLQFIDKHMRLLARVLLINLFNNNVDLFLHLVCDAVCSKNTVTIMLCFCWLSVEVGASNYASASRREPRSQHRTLLVPASRRFSLERFRTRICIDLRTTHFPHPAVFLKPSPQLNPQSDTCVLLFLQFFVPWSFRGDPFLYNNPHMDHWFTAHTVSRTRGGVRFK